MSPHWLLTLTMVCNRLRHTLLPAVRWSRHPHCATNLLTRLSVNWTHFFHVCIQWEWCGVQRVNFRQHVAQQHPMGREWENKVEFRKENMCTIIYTSVAWEKKGWQYRQKKMYPLLSPLLLLNLLEILLSSGLYEVCHSRDAAHVIHRHKEQQWSQLSSEEFFGWFTSENHRMRLTGTSRGCLEQPPFSSRGT